MNRALNDTAAALEQLTGELRELERRVRALEIRSSALPASADGAAADGRRSAAEPQIPPALGRLPSVTLGLIPVWGRAILGIAGAFLLRAAAESGIVPLSAAAAVGILYAALWLASSYRIRRPGELARMTYAGTAALIFFPLLWETTAEFKVLPALDAAGLLVGFVLLASVLAWLAGREGLVWMTALPAAVTAVFLMVGLGELGPFVAALLAICALVEGGAIRGRSAGLRWLIAIMTDFGVWHMLHVVTLPQPLETYQPLGRPAAAWLCFALVGIYTVSAGARTGILGRGITLFEMLQWGVACTLAIAGVLQLTGDAAAVGLACALSGAVLYGGALLRFAASRRNQAVYASFGLALLFVGSVLPLSASVAALLWSGLAIAAALASARVSHLLLAIHGAVCVVVSAVLSGLLHYSRLAMTGSTLPSPPSAVLWMVSAAALFAYARCFDGPGGRWPRLVCASVATLAVSAFCVALVSAVWAPPAAWLPTIRTLVICAVILSAGVAGTGFPAGAVAAANGSSPEPLLPPGLAKAGRIEMIWIAYFAMALLTVKLFAEDFRESSPAALAVSLLGYGAVLLAGPRLTRLGTSRR